MLANAVTRSLAAAMVIGALALTSCSSAGNAETGETPATGGTLTVALDRELPTLDVANGLISQQPVLILANALYQPLMTAGIGGEVVPDMAESLIPDETATEWKLTLPADLTFSDGTALTAEDVQAHIERLGDPATKASSAGQIAQITQMTVADDTTITFTLARPNADFASQFSRALGMITSTEAVDEFGFPLGAGPYVVEDFVAGDSVTVVRNENYWGEPAILDSITFQMMPDADSRYQSLQAGDIDLMWTEITSQFQQARSESALSVHAAPAAVSTIVLNIQDERLADPAVRRALAQGIDRDALNAVVNLGEGVTIDGPFGLLTDAAPEVDYPAYDPEAAAAVLEEKNLSFSFTVENRPDTIQRATAIKDMLHKVGVEIEIAPVESASFGSSLVSGEFELADMVTSIYADPSGGTMIATSSGPYNFVGYANPVVDAELAAASALTERSARAEHFAAASAQLSEDLPILFLTASNAGLIGNADLLGLPDLEGRTLISIKPELIGWSKR